MDLDTDTIQWASEGVVAGEPVLFGPFGELVQILKAHLNRNISKADDLGTSFAKKEDEMSVNDKLVRTAFLHCFCKLLSGYRQSLNYLRVVPNSRIILDAKKFLGENSEEKVSPLQTFI